MANSRSSSLLEKLSAVVGEQYVIIDRDDLQKYAQDETEDFRYMPDVAVLPGSEEEVSRILALASALGISVTPRAGGTGLSGGALCVQGGISLSVERMNAILEIDEQNMMARVQPGVITAVFQDAVEEKGLFYPPDPASRESCNLGGNLAEDAGGPRAAKYGTTSAYVRGLRAVLPSGEVISTGGKMLKDVAGYNLTQLLVGSEGTLAVITEATFRLVPLPRYRRTMMVPFNSLDEAACAVPGVIVKGMVPSALEFMEQPSLLAVEKLRGIKIPHSDAAAQLLIELDGFDEEMLDAEIVKAGEICMALGARDVFLAETRAHQEKLWKIRRDIGEAVKSQSAYRELDTAVPRMKIPDVVRKTHEICDRFQVRLMCYGHAGDGNLHMNILIDQLSPEEWAERIKEVTAQVFDAVTELGGSITGEHGVGIVAKDYLERALGGKNVGLMREIKKVFDPKGVLNPGKIFSA